jgi:hypothetical protein
MLKRLRLNHYLRTVRGSTCSRRTAHAWPARPAAARLSSQPAAPARRRLLGVAWTRARRRARAAGHGPPDTGRRTRAQKRPAAEPCSGAPRCSGVQEAGTGGGYRGRVQGAGTGGAASYTPGTCTPALPYAPVTSAPVTSAHVRSGTCSRRARTLRHLQQTRTYAPAPAADAHVRSGTCSRRARTLQAHVSSRTCLTRALV